MTGDEVFGNIERTDEDFRNFLAKNPQGSFRDYYVVQACKTLDRNEPHASLGANLRSGKDWSQAGYDKFELLTRAGLQPNHVCVDYGCGTLRVGQHLMRYLEPKCYWGLDITDRFLSIGLDMLGRGLVADRKPNLRLINCPTLCEVRDAKPDYILCVCVLRHVPPAELNAFFDEFMSVIVEGTVAIVTGQLSKSVLRQSGRSWAYPKVLLTDLIQKRGGTVRFEIDSPTYTVERVGSHQQMRMRIERTS